MSQEVLTIRVAAGAGDGIDTTGHNLTKALLRSGLHVYTHRHYASRIRGSHTYFEVQASDEPLTAWRDETHVLLALGDSFARSANPQAYYDTAEAGPEEFHPLTENLDSLVEGGVLVYDSGLLTAKKMEEHLPDLEKRAEDAGWHLVPLDLTGMAKEHGKKIMRNTAGVAAVVALLGLDAKRFQEVMRDQMKPKILEANLALFEDVLEQVQEAYGVLEDGPRVPEGTVEGERVLMAGNQAVAYGALLEGIRFASGYPMTPATSLFETLTDWFHDVEPKGVSHQVEDEISGLQTALGASHAGVKAMTTTSGGGFSLWVEGVGLAEVTETPVLLAEVMRGGPSTGLPTKPEQSDLEHVLFSSQGDACRVVLAPGNLEQLFEFTRDAARIAYGDPENGWEGFQGPVVLLYDAELARLYQDLPRDVLEGHQASPYVGAVPTRADLDAADELGFKRYAYDAPGGVPLRPLPGQRGGRYLATGNEHNEHGHIDEDPRNRRRMMDRRLSKLRAVSDLLRDGLGGHQTRFGSDDAPLGILCWGGTLGTVQAAVEDLEAAGTPVSALHVADLSPFPRGEVLAFLQDVDRCLVVEQNATGQFRGLVQRELGEHGGKLASLLKYDGNPLTPQAVADGVSALREGRATQEGFNTRLTVPREVPAPLATGGDA